LDIINHNIKTLRKLENIKSQNEFGLRIGVPSHNINKYENSVIPKPEILRTIAVEFKINLHLFITKELTERNYEEFKIEHNTEAKLESIINQSDSKFEIRRSDLDRVATFFNDKLDLVEGNNINKIDRERLLLDIRSIFIAYNKKLKQFYIMQDHLAEIIGKEKTSQL